jgi:hypothetical protein
MKRTVKPKRMLVHMGENGKVTADVRLPYSLFKMGMKFGKMASKEDFGDCEEAMAFLQEFDTAAFEQALATGDETLPAVLVDVCEPEKDSRVTITLE